jgi:hypothetical protein
VFGKYTFTDRKKWIPKDFNWKHDFLLVEKYPVSDELNNEMVKYLNKSYRGKYEVVDRQTIFSKQGKYSNADHFAYALLWDTTTVNEKVNRNKPAPIGYFYDRANDQKYPTTQKKNRYDVEKRYRQYIDSIDPI